MFKIYRVVPKNEILLLRNYPSTDNTIFAIHLKDNLYLTYYFDIGKLFGMKPLTPDKGYITFEVDEKQIIEVTKLDGYYSEILKVAFESYQNDLFNKKIEEIVNE